MTTNELAQVLKSVLQPHDNTFLGPAEWIAIVSAVAAILAAVIALLALRNSNHANAIAERIAKRAGVIELHQAWQNVNRFDPKNPLFSDAIRAVNALELTASLWNHDVLEKEILFQSYWKWFKEFYNVLSACQLIIPKDGRRVCDMIAPSVSLTYRQMEDRELHSIPQTSINNG
jgi:hypothetical protein